MAYALSDIQGRKYPVGARLQIGSAPGNQVVLLDPQVLPVHATLWEQPGKLYLQDGSEGRATFVNRSLIQGVVSLQMGDQVGIGGTLFTVSDPNAQPAAPAPAPKKRFGCMRWLLVGAGMFMLECLLLAAVGFILASSDVELRGGINDLQQLLSLQQNPTDVHPPSDKQQPGPDVLSLTDPWLITNFTGSYSQNESTTVEGVTPSGAAIKTSVVRNSMEQANPDWTTYSLIQQSTNDQVIDRYESAIIQGMVYSGSTTCSSHPDPKAGELHLMDARPYSILTRDLTRHLKRVETGISINGVITDRYELRRDNFMDPEAVVEFVSGSLYRAREGGYLVQLDYVIKIKPQSWATNMGDDFSMSELSQVTYHFDRVYAPEGTLTAKAPEVCAGQLK